MKSYNIAAKAASSMEDELIECIDNPKENEVKFRIHQPYVFGINQKETVKKIKKNWIHDLFQEIVK